MSPESRFQALTRDEQIANADRIIGSARRGPTLVRCDGTHEEYVEYRLGGDVRGWEVLGSPAVGDLMLSVVQLHRVRLIVSLSRIDELDGDGVLIDGRSDIEFRPAVEWSRVMQRAGVTGRWERVQGKERAAVLDALLATLANDREIPESEGREQRRDCRSRSTKNRERALDRANGECAACGINLRAKFGAAGDRGLEAHHTVPLHRRTGDVQTPVSELVVLCATCHRLLHTDPDVSLNKLRDRWANPAT